MSCRRRCFRFKRRSRKDPRARIPARRLRPNTLTLIPPNGDSRRRWGLTANGWNRKECPARRRTSRRAGLEGTELIGVNLRYADLGDADLTASDLLLADLRDACLVRTNLQEACLVGANLEGANLEGASLESAMGLVPRQLAGANLRDASLPAQVAEFPALGEFTRESAAVARFFGALVASSLIAWLIIWKTKDVQLLTDSSIIPFLRSSAAATALPTGEIYLIAPVALFILYLVFHYHAQRLWDAVLELPAVFPDGRVLGENGPRIVTGLARAHFRWMSSDSASTRFIEKGAAMILGVLARSRDADFVLGAIPDAAGNSRHDPARATRCRRDSRRDHLHVHNRKAARTVGDPRQEPHQRNRETENSTSDVCCNRPSRIFHVPIAGRDSRRAP